MVRKKTKIDKDTDKVEAQANEAEQQETNENKDVSEEPLDEFSNETSETEQNTETPADSYEDLKKKLLEEYENQKYPAQEPQEDQDEPLEENEVNSNEEETLETPEEQTEETFEEPSFQETTETTEPEESDELEIEDVNQINSQTEEQLSLTEEQKNITPDVEEGSSKVAISKGSSIAIMIAVGLIIVYIIYKMLSPSPDDLAANPIKEVNNKLPTVKPVQDSGQTIVVPDVPKLPDVPQLTAPIAPPAPTPPPPPVLNMDLPTPPQIPAVVQQAPTISNLFNAPTSPLSTALQEDPAIAARKQAKLKANIMFMNGGSGPSSKKNIDSKGDSLISLSATGGQTAATDMGNLQRIIGQGKMIYATLETAINTDIPGMVRGLISRDVYSESGKNILIPRGSRLVGTYSSDITFGQARVQITWTRVMRPDGIDIRVNSPSADALGHAGISGDVDNHLMHNVGNMLMMSVINVALGKYADKKAGNTNSTTTTINPILPSTNSTTTTGTTSSNQTVNTTPTVVTSGPTQTNTQAAYQSAINSISQMGEDYVKKGASVPPTITIDQGTAVRVYVAQDLVFPGRSANLTKVIE